MNHTGEDSSHARRATTVNMLAGLRLCWQVHCVLLTEPLIDLFTEMSIDLHTEVSIDLLSEPFIDLLTEVSIDLPTEVSIDLPTELLRAVHRTTNITAQTYTHNC